MNWRKYIGAVGCSLVFYGIGYYHQPLGLLAAVIGFVFSIVNFWGWGGLDNL